MNAFYPLCIYLFIYLFATIALSLSCVLFFLTFCSVLFCVICVNVARFSITLSCECAYVIRSPPTQKSVPLPQRLGWEPEHGALHSFSLSSLCYFLLCVCVYVICSVSLNANWCQVGSCTEPQLLAGEENRPLSQSSRTIMQPEEVGNKVW